MDRTETSAHVKQAPAPDSPSDSAALCDTEAMDLAQAYGPRLAITEFFPEFHTDFCWAA